MGFAADKTSLNEGSDVSLEVHTEVVALQVVFVIAVCEETAPNMGNSSRAVNVNLEETAKSSLLSCVVPVFATGGCVVFDDSRADGNILPDRAVTEKLS